MVAGGGGGGAEGDGDLVDVFIVGGEVVVDDGVVVGGDG